MFYLFNLNFVKVKKKLLAFLGLLATIGGIVLGSFLQIPNAHAAACGFDSDMVCCIPNGGNDCFCPDSEHLKFE